MSSIGLGRAKAWPEIRPAGHEFWVARPEPHFMWPDPALYYALLTEKLVKNWLKYVKISGPNPTRAQYGQPEPDPSQKKSGPTQP